MTRFEINEIKVPKFAIQSFLSLSFINKTYKMKTDHFQNKRNKKNEINRFFLSLICLACFLFSTFLLLKENKECLMNLNNFTFEPEFGLIEYGQGGYEIKIVYTIQSIQKRSPSILKTLFNKQKGTNVYITKKVQPNLSSTSSTTTTTEKVRMYKGRIISEKPKTKQYFQSVKDTINSVLSKNEKSSKEDKVAPINVEVKTSPPPPKMSSWKQNGKTKKVSFDKDVGNNQSPFHQKRELSKMTLNKRGREERKRKLTKVPSSESFTRSTHHDHHHIVPGQAPSTSNTNPMFHIDKMKKTGKEFHSESRGAGTSSSMSGIGMGLANLHIHNIDELHDSHSHFHPTTFSNDGGESHHSLHSPSHSFPQTTSSKSSRRSRGSFTSGSSKRSSRMAMIRSDSTLSTATSTQFMGMRTHSPPPRSNSQNSFTPNSSPGGSHGRTNDRDLWWYNSSSSSDTD